MLESMRVDGLGLDRTGALLMPRMNESLSGVNGVGVPAGFIRSQFAKLLERSALFRNDGLVLSDDSLGEAAGF